MLADFVTELPSLLAQAAPRTGGRIFHPVDGATPNIELILRWIHFISGIVWIGHLYFFNLVNVSLMKALDGPTKGKVIPQLMPRALWWFRWGAVVTVLAGLFYFILILHTEPDTWPNFFKWLIIVLVTYVIIFFLLRVAPGGDKPGPLNNGWILAVVVGLVVTVMALVILLFMSEPGETRAGNIQDVSNRALSIAIGGGLGLILLLNVWGIIGPHQKRIIAWTDENARNGTAIPAESAKLARRAFLASRINTWLSIPMLFFMATASHYALFGR
jgi:uncharacterized membrane protein